MSYINFDDFLFFMTFAESSNGSEAAKRLGVSQPTLSERLRQFEAKLPESPFSWAGKKKILNAYGRHLLEVVRPKLQEVQGTLRDAVRSAPGATPFRSVVSGRIEVLAHLARGLKSTGTLHLEPCTSEKATRSLLAGQCDVAISRLQPQNADFISHKLFVGRPVLCFHREKLKLQWKNLPPPKSETWKELFGHVCLSYGSEDSYLEMFLRHAKFEREQCQLSLSCANWLVVKELLLLGRGFSVLPFEVVSGDKDLVTFEWPHSPRSTYFIQYRKSFSRLAAGRELVEKIRELFGTLGR